MEHMVSKYDFSQFEVVTKNPGKIELKGLMKFICSIHIEVEDITNEDEKLNHQKVVIVTYAYDGKKFTTKPLYYKHVSHSRDVKEPSRLLEYFGQDVYWLDIDIHKWPQESNETEIDNLIINDITDDLDFRNFLKMLANNASKGAIQRITKQGRSGQYFRNLENNNHWHDLVLMIQHIIRYGEMSQELFKSLIFRWDGNKNTDRLRSSLSPHFGGRALITNLVENVKKHFNPMDRKIIELILYKKQIILQGPPGTGKTLLAKKIAESLLETGHSTVLKKPAEITVEDIQELVKVRESFRSVTNYTDYEVMKVNDGSFTVKTHSTGKEYPATFANIIKYYKDETWSKVGTIKYGNDSYEAAIAKYIYEQIEAIEQKEQIDNTDRLQIMQFHPSFTYEDFVRGIEADTNKDQLVYQAKNKPLILLANEAILNPEKNYVLILDEINRANLSAVLGELIYALEYRGEPVNSMYEVGSSSELLLPNNLYIIGTMNTADRSVGHFDYAIRRRFAFVDVLPKNLQEELTSKFDLKLFSKVANLFVENYDSNIDYNDHLDQIKRSKFLSEEFRPEDVWLGHSYFIEKERATMEMRLKYEIKPILLEYIKDGVLKEEARPYVLALPNDVSAK